MNDEPIKLSGKSRSIELREEDRNREIAISDIARSHLRIETLETRMNDEMDFHTVSVWNIKHALISAFFAGRASVND